MSECIITTPEPDPRVEIVRKGDNHFVVDAHGNLQWADAKGIEYTKRFYARRGADFSRMRRAQTIDARALLDGRIPEGWTHDQPIPLNCLAFGVDGNLKTHEWYSELLCTCPVPLRES